MQVVNNFPKELMCLKIASSPDQLLRLTQSPLINPVYSLPYYIFNMQL